MSNFESTDLVSYTSKSVGTRIIAGVYHHSDDSFTKCQK